MVGFLGYNPTAVPTPGGVSPVSYATTAELLCEFRKVTGMSWTVLAACFGVSPRTLIGWVTGGILPAKHEMLIRETALGVERAVKKRQVAHYKDVLTQHLLLKYLTQPGNISTVA